MNNSFLINGNIEDNKVIANAFNDLYIHIGSNVVGKIKPSNPYINPTRYIKIMLQIPFLLHLQQTWKYLKYLII